ncbi:MAG: PepSY domain-containing protein [Xanthomonadales bacterium]|nr:hypothetical protein [Xanthomonadales bacterium]MCC6592364.1 PepSY domain-containing protein [Xanthomonadales bacterium]
MKNTLVLVAAVALGFGVIGFAAPGALSPDDALARVSAAGYSATGEIDLDDGVYEIDARDRDGRLVEVHVDAASGEILSPPQPGQVALTADQIRARLTQAGYNEVRELERDDGLWKAEVRLPDGSERELRIHPYSGAIVGEEVED